MRWHILLCLIACRAPVRESADASSNDPSAACKVMGASCTFSPGKLGTCVEVEPATNPATLVCQSQH